MTYGSIERLETDSSAFRQSAFCCNDQSRQLMNTTAKIGLIMLAYTAAGIELYYGIKILRSPAPIHNPTFMFLLMSFLLVTGSALLGAPSIYLGSLACRKCSPEQSDLNYERMNHA